MKKFLLPLLLVVAGALASCGGNAQLGKVITKEEWKSMAEQAQQLQETMPEPLSIVVKGSYTDTRNGRNMSLDCTITPDIEEPTEVMTVVTTVMTGYTFSYASSQFENAKQLYETRGGKVKLDYFYDEKTGNLGFDANVTFNQKAGGQYMNQSVQGTYQWNKYGLLVFCDEVSKLETNVAGQQGYNCSVKLDITFNF